MRNCILLVAILSVFAVSELRATDVSGKREASWKALERALVDKHENTDTQSLIDLSISDKSLGLRSKAVEILGLRGEKQSQSSLEQLLSDNQPRFLRETSALALARLGNPAGLKILREFAANSPSRDRQIFLAARLAELGDPVGFDWVSQAAKGADVRAKYLSIAALIPFVTMPQEGKAADVKELFLGLAKDKDASIRKELFTELSLTFGTSLQTEAFFVLAQTASKNDPDQEVRQSAENFIALWRIESQQKGPR